ncbi:hypothetical protein BC826DRAFT_68942 [Russula brevipes]|nr:hypothetical protein BC826DRAFT_68942 [Russula brevipes]
MTTVRAVHHHSYLPCLALGATDDPSTHQRINCDNGARHRPHANSELSFPTFSSVWRTSNDSGHVLHTCLAVGHPGGVSSQSLPPHALQAYHEILSRQRQQQANPRLLGQCDGKVWSRQTVNVCAPPAATPVGEVSIKDDGTEERQDVLEDIHAGSSRTLARTSLE